ncbi:type VI secretion system protein TssA [Pluralibacter gergoviae]|uniref:type VI secretion system protein TssA n=1 Tax=Pluralibacter gergoviae TaxID=61647 RepID=UPI000A4F2B80|nr:type VI secretion system protein TssA [Pluralibacter gergoviae]
METQHPWCQRLLAPLPEETLRAAVNPDDPLWEKIETGMVKLGSLAHGEVNLNQLADHCLTLLEKKTKDMRVLAQLVRCLQHPAKAPPFSTALALLNSWLTQYWQVAWPTSLKQKQRLMLQMVKRFEGVIDRVIEQATAAEITALSHSLEGMAATWCEVAPGQEAMLDNLISASRRAASRRHAQEKADLAPAAHRSAGSSGSAVSSAGNSPSIDCSDDRAWRKTLLQVADLLVSQQPDMPVGYRLRRHAIWSTITTAPVANAGNKTQLASIAADRVNEYEAALGQATPDLWQQIEQSLTLSPYWFVGHLLSAKAAQHLGYATVASAIASELNAFLTRLPLLQEMTFSDGSPFLPEEVREWQQRENTPTAASVQQDLSSEVQRCHKEQGLAAALERLNEQSHNAEPRERFYASVMLAELLAEEGMQSLAATHFQRLLQESQQRGLELWEPKLVRRLERFSRHRG